MNLCFHIFIVFSQLVLNLSVIVCLFVEVGEYPDLYNFGVNNQECGLSYVPRVYNIPFSVNCFKNNYENKIVHNVKGIQLHRKSDNVNPRVWNGIWADEGQAPWAVYIKVGIQRWSSGYKSICDGVLITFEWILTSGHCNQNRYRSVVWAGSRQKAMGVMKIANIQKWFAPPFQKAYSNEYDVALVKLEAPFERQRMKGLPLRYTLNTICLPKMNQKNNETERTVLYSWGVINDDEDKSNWLRRISVELLPADLCWHNNTLCASTFSSLPHPCPGDYGAGLVQYTDRHETRAILVGTVGGLDWEKRRKTKKCSTAKYIEFTLISKHIDWILKTIKKE